MTYPDRIGVLSGDRLSVTVPPSYLEAEPDDGSEYWPDHIGDYHAVRDSTVADLIDAIDAGTVEPLPKPEG